MAIPAFEYRRKGWHMLSGVLVTPMVVFTNLPYVTLVAVAAFLFILVTELLSVHWGIHLPFWSDQLRRTKRAHEVFSYASLAFLGTVVLLLWLTPLPVAFAACAQLALGDGTSALAGRAFGRVPLPYNKEKTVVGSLAGFVAGSAGAFGILAWYFWYVEGVAFFQDPVPVTLVAIVCVVGGFFAALAESLPRLEDNVTVPLSSGVAMTLLWWTFGLTPSSAALWTRLGLA